MGISAFRVLERQKEAIHPSKSSSQYPELAEIVHPHIHSFNALFSSNLLEEATSLIRPITVFSGTPDMPLSQRTKVVFFLSHPTLAKPVLENKGLNCLSYPALCRESGSSYKAAFQIKLHYSVDDGPLQTDVKSLGSLPVMVRSNRCNLDQLSPMELVSRHEDPEEFGGYFITNGIERLIRLLIVPRRNHATALIRPSFMNRGPTFSKNGVSIRCVRKDQSSQSLTLHYLTDGEIMLRFSYRKNEYMIPVLMILRSLRKTSDKEIFERLTKDIYDSGLIDRVEMLLRSYKGIGLYNEERVLGYLGSKFGVMLDVPEDSTEHAAGLQFLEDIILVHLDTKAEKFEMLIFMMQKLYGLVSGQYGEDNPDSLQFQETLLGGHLYLGIIKEKLVDLLESIKLLIQSDLRKSPAKVDFRDKNYMAPMIKKAVTLSDIGRKLEYFLATGNLVSNTGLDLQQTTGYTIIAEKLNFYRYIAHFRSIHRGSFFAELKTTTVRKLLPESWGFLCPVHTPDGTPCGLLNHLSHTCKIITEKIDVSMLPSLISSLGAGQGTARSIDGLEVMSIQLDGKVIGYAPAKLTLQIARLLREFKVKGLHNVPLELEIGYVPLSKGGQYPGLYLFSTPARMVRAVKYLKSGDKDLVGPFEQVYMDIACMSEDVVVGLTTHIEYDPTDMLSIIASLTPFSDFNQSPRNMYQCQMGKQAMGTPAQNLVHRTDNKMYRLQTGQTPIVRPKGHDGFGMDGYPNGMNAVVCVISYTGYDMEDASIISKSSYERGYGYGSIYKGQWVDLAAFRRKGERISHRFGFIADGEQETDMSRSQLERVSMFLDEDGLPLVGVRLSNGDPFYAFVDDVTGAVEVKLYKGMEDAFVDQVRLVGSESLDPLQKIHIKLRVPRPPVIGDKFSSRHGQKGVISQKWPTVDMPFSESGIVPDVIINPHAFPSRMTIGMFIESLAGKAGALHGISQDATAFRFNEENVAADYFGTQLAEAGFNYHGNEPMYSGITGEEFKADIYIGVVYYQRLRHMVSDKYQVRTTGPVHNLTRQPIKGRKRAGGIRLGEMERDSLLAHGVSFILQDRLMNCSDYTQCHICKACGSILSPTQVKRGPLTVVPSRGTTIYCQTCDSNENIDIIAIPYVFKYLCSELVAMNVRLTLNCK